MTNKGYLPVSLKPVGCQNFQVRLCDEEKTPLITLGLVQIYRTTEAEYTTAITLFI
jgi:hypothetical protein